MIAIEKSYVIYRIASLPIISNQFQRDFIY